VKKQPKTTQKRIVEVNVLYGEVYRQSLESFRILLNDCVKKIPVEFRDSIQVETIKDEDWEGDRSEPYVTPKFKISYSRPETDQEEAKREADEKAQRDKWEALELAQLERLQVKYKEV
jgi:hypothetical protein